MLNSRSPYHARLLSALAIVSAAAMCAHAQEVFRTSESTTGTIELDGVVYNFLALCVQESGDSDGDGVADYEGDSTFTGAVLVDRVDDPLPAYVPPPVTWFPELLDHIRALSHDPWNQYYLAAGDGFHGETEYEWGPGQSIDCVVNETGPLSWSLSSAVTGVCINRPGITLPVVKESYYIVQIDGEGGGFVEFRTMQGGAPLVVSAVTAVQAHTALPAKFDYFTVTEVRLESYDGTTGEFAGTCSSSFRAEAPCRFADLNGDGIVDFGDYLEFLNLYEAGHLRVDFNGDGLVDFSDYLEFLNLYDACTS